MQQNQEWKYCSNSNHSKYEIEKFCKEENCNENRLICHKCLTESKHIGHLYKLEQIQKLQNYFQKQSENYGSFQNELQGYINNVSEGLKQILIQFQETYQVQNEKIQTFSSKQLNKALNNTFYFEKYIKKEIMEKIKFGFNQQVVWILGQCLRMLDKETDALPWLDRALQINPNHVDSLFSKGECLRILEKENEALQCQEEAIKINPTHIGALYSAGLLDNNLGECLRALGRKQEALNYLEKALEINPNHIRSLGSKAACLADFKRYKEAIIFYDKALKLDPNYKFSINGKSNQIKYILEFCLEKLS